MSLNVNGLKNRIESPDFIEKNCENDIVCIQETKTDICDHSFLEESLNKINYAINLKSRKYYSNHRCGGLAIIVKKAF